MATGDPLKASKAIVAAVLGFLAPGALYLTGVADDGITSTEWIIGALYCVAAGALLGGAVYKVENKPKAKA